MTYKLGQAIIVVMICMMFFMFFLWLAKGMLDATEYNYVPDNCLRSEQAIKEIKKVLHDL